MPAYEDEKVSGGAANLLTFTLPPSCCAIFLRITGDTSETSTLNSISLADGRGGGTEVTTHLEGVVKPQSILRRDEPISEDAALFVAPKSQQLVLILCGNVFQVA